MPTKKTTAKKSSAKAAPKPKQTTSKAKKPTAGKPATPKPAAKAAPAKATGKKAPAAEKHSKAAAKAPADKPVKAAKGNTPATPKKEKPKASDLIKQASHTPAIFKTGTRRTVHVLFTLDDVRDVIKKRAKEELADRAAGKAAGNGNGTDAKGKPLSDGRNISNSKHQAASLADILGITQTSSAGRGGPGSVPKKFQKYYKLLVELRDHVRNELNLHSSDTLKRSQKEDAGDISISVDAGTDNFDRDFALSLLSSEQETLKEIEAAIQRIHDGTYGRCEVTGEPINTERLEAVPFTRFSLEGQRQFEMNSRKRVSRTGAFLIEAAGETISFGDDDTDN